MPDDGGAHGGALTDGPLILGIESSCDETGVALVRGNTLLADVTASSMAEHARYGGIIPEIAARAHLDAFVPTLQAALAEASSVVEPVETPDLSSVETTTNPGAARPLTLTDIDAIAVTAGPGLVGSLNIGAAAAKALAIALDIPLYGVNHVIGHAAVDQLVHGPFPKPCIALIVSGGHSSLLLINDVAQDIVELGSTLDDAAGEAFDKVGRLLGLPYPGGPHVDALARRGNPNAIKFPRGLSAPKYAKTHPYDFSFSGLKTAVARYIEALPVVEPVETTTPSLNPAPPIPDALRADIAASFAAAVVDVLTAKAITACRRYGVDTLVIGGGFSANTQLRELAAKRCAEAGIALRIPPPRFCTDNGAMIAALGSAVVAAGLPPSPLDFGVTSAMNLEAIVV